VEYVVKIRDEIWNRTQDLCIVDSLEMIEQISWALGSIWAFC
jgi:hypothetical protein